MHLPSLQRADIASLGQVGAAQQLQQQRILDAQQEANRLQAFEPQTRLDTYGRGIAQLISGYPGSSQVTQTPNPISFTNSSWSCFYNRWTIWRKKKLMSRTIKKTNV